ncbi:DUF5753 domain-containing protein [Streptomyces sp. H34-S4]|uniref:DUF5753 domain-containing protein n=1 Tax=Streptomyces sp. H34-S4 TaxID=2996463 RepID=UPI002271A72C|nr:DUF5753 domain-containing protein [Streptomyces sp. H34-S4]MCY0937542.1 DUF5753 domain-containing protein [Streptomyces sp. H34-S4]
MPQSDVRLEHWQDKVPVWPRRPSLLDPHRYYLLQRWDEGEHSSTALHREITGRGYTGGYGPVRDFLAPHRAAERQHRAGPPPRPAAPAYAAAVIAETIPRATPEQIATRLEVRLRRQHRIHHPARALRLWAVLDESALRREVAGPAIMRDQLEHLNYLSTQPYITVQVLPHGAGAHPGISGQFSILHFADAPGAATVYLERFTSDLHLEKRSDVERYSVMYERLQAKALNPDSTRHFITRAAETHTG